MAYRNGDSSNSGCTCKYDFHRCQSVKRAITRFVFDLAKDDLAYYYKQSIDEVDEIRRAAWACSNSPTPS